MKASVVEGQRWKRRADGRVVEVEYVGMTGAHVDVRIVATGRMTVMTVQRLLESHDLMGGRK